MRRAALPGSPDPVDMPVPRCWRVPFVPSGALPVPRSWRVLPRPNDAAAIPRSCASADRPRLISRIYGLIGLLYVSRCFTTGAVAPRDGRSSVSTRTGRESANLLISKDFSMGIVLIVNEIRSHLDLALA